MTIRFKLSMTAIAVILVANSLVSLAGVGYLGRVWLGEVQNRVRRNLNSARASYDNHVDGISLFLHGLALDRTLAAALEANDHQTIQSVLQDAHRTGVMDFLCVLDPRGRVLSRARNPRRAGDDLQTTAIVAEALAQGRPAMGTVVLRPEELAAEGPDLADRARFELIPTPAAWPTEEKSRSDGMVVAAAIPIVDPQRQLLGLLYGGDLLNRRYEIVDSIKQEVFAQQVYEGRDIGTVTIFQGDLRISTNVMTDDGQRAVGTRLSAAVADEVLVRGGIWARPAFVVNDWYITAYEPIRDPTGRIIGALYVGLLQEPFLHQRNVIAGVFLGIIAVATVASLVLLFLVTMLVLQPVGHIVAMSQKVVAGDLSARVGIRAPGEMGVLCQAVDAMADALAQREEQLKLAARQQISRTEKMASIGRLAAGIAHEINNPLTGVLTFAHLLRDKPNMDEQDKQDLNVIIHETSRVGEIVRGLLDFARERPAVKEPLDINDVVQRTMRLIRGQKQFERISIVEDLRENLPEVDGDMNQLQQVLLNLSLNACEAMPGGGTLLISTLTVDGNVLIEVADTGCGIRPEHLEQVFEPFFSTKPVGKGTGLGLSVSYGIIQQHGGTLEVKSQEGQGSTFTIALPPAESQASPPSIPRPSRE